MTGVRRAEVLGLRWADFDVEAGRLRIVQTATLVGARIVFGTPKTEKGRRTMSIDPGTVAVLREHRQR